MVFVARALTPEQVEAASADAGLLGRLVFDDAEDASGPDESDCGQEACGSCHGAPSVDLDKSWHGIHFLLTGTVWDCSTPLGMAILGGRPIGEDNGYGPARLLEGDTVKAVAEALSVVDHQVLRHRFDPLEFQRAEIYPDGIWDEEDILEEYLLPNLRMLTQFYGDAAAHGSAVLQALV